MKIKSARPLSELKSVLMDANSSGPDPAYWVFEDITKDKWHNMTVTAPGDYNGEFPKTFGHYHGSDSNETYKLIKAKEAQSVKNDSICTSACYVQTCI